MKHWIGWLADNQWIAENCSRSIKLPKEEHRLPAAHLNLSEVDTLLNVVDVTTALGLRDRSIMETFYSTGMRRAELANLQLDDIDHERRLVVIRQGKNRKDRVVPIGQRAIEWLEKYIKEVRVELEQEDRDTVYLSRNGNKFQVNNLSLLVRSYIKAAGIGKRGSCHILRHTTATLMLENGADLRAIQTLLGHANLNTTQIYTHVSIQHLRKVHDQTHPATPDEPKTPENPSETAPNRDSGEKPEPNSDKS
jgi:integrase/recombinase XerD